MKRIDIVKLLQVKERSVPFETKQITTPETAVRLINQTFNLEEECQEVLGIITLSTKLKVNGIHQVSRGTLNECHFSPRDIFKAAFSNNAEGIIIFHNHPSGDPTPSNHDIEGTKRLRQAGELIGISVYDHVIIGENSFASLRELGLLR